MNDIKTITIFSKMFKAIEIMKKILIAVCLMFVLFKLIKIKRRMPKFRGLLK